MVPYLGCVDMEKFVSQQYPQLFRKEGDGEGLANSMEGRWDPLWVSLGLLRTKCLTEF